jgi:hypothetical protein
LTKVASYTAIDPLDKSSIVSGLIMVVLAIGECAPQKPARSPMASSTSSPIDPIIFDCSVSGLFLS